MTSYEKIKELADQGKINEARLVYAREYLADGPRRTGANLLKWVTGEMTVKELNKEYQTADERNTGNGKAVI